MVPRFSITLCAAALACLMAPSMARAGISVIHKVTATGAAPIENGQVTQARERAIHDALRRAVESGAGVLLASESEARDNILLSDSIYARAEGFVKRYDVLDEKKTGDMYYVTIRALVMKAKLANKLVDVLVLDEQMDMPQIMVLVSDAKGRYEDPQRSARSILVQKFTEKRFRLINPKVAQKLQGDRATLAAIREDRNLAAKLANEHAAELVVIATVAAENKGSSKGLAQSQGILRILVINPTTGQEFIGDESELTGAGKTYPEAARAAARRVASDAGSYAINQLILWWIRQAGHGQEYDIDLLNPGSLRRVGRPFAAMLKKVQGVRQVKTVSQSKELVRLRVKFEGGSKSLLTNGIFDKCDNIAALKSIDLQLDQGNHLVFYLEDNPPAAKGAATKAVIVGMLPFENKTDWRELNSTALACTRRAESVLVKAKRFEVVDRIRLKTVLKEADMLDAGLLEAAEAMELGRLLPADALVLGEISGQKQTLRVFLRIVRADTGKVLYTVESAVKVGDRDTLPDVFERAIREAIGAKKVTDYVEKLGLPRP